MILKQKKNLLINVCLMMFSCLISRTVLAQTQDSIPLQATNIEQPAPAQTNTAEEETKKEKGNGFNSKARFGLRGGGVISNQSFEEGIPDDDVKSKLGLDLGILYSIPIGGGFFALQPELHWMQKGSTISDIQTGEDLTTTLNYIELPLLARINFGGSLRLFAFGGPSVGLLLDVESESVEITSDDFEDSDVGLHLGAGVGIGTFEVDIRYMAGLTDVADSQGNPGEVKNSAYGAGITLKF